jgi:uncharacterized protein (DUF2132 family)
MPDSQVNNPVHGLTLEFILVQLKAHYGFRKLGQMIPIRCFIWEPSIKSSLVFLRKTDWARAKVEELYIHTQFDEKTYATTELEYHISKKKK